MTLILQKKSSEIIEKSSWFRHNPHFFYKDEDAAKEYLMSIGVKHHKERRDSVVSAAEGGDDDYHRV